MWQPMLFQKYDMEKILRSAQDDKHIGVILSGAKDLPHLY